MLDGLAADAHGLDEAGLLVGRKILHFAPERQLRKRVQAAAKTYITADFERGDCDVRLDMSAMPQVADASFETVIACDVLEHVPDDLAAMREIRRILVHGGAALLTVPQMDPPAVTDADPSVVDPSEREQRFGQKDHVRIYGDDFEQRLTASGFAVRIVAKSAFSAELCRHHVLHPPRESPHRLATNHRRLYIAGAA